MNTLALSLMIQASMLGASKQDYSTAYEKAVKDNQPLVVLVGADWCPSCVRMKQSVIPQLERDGDLGKVAFAMVDYDREGRLATQLMQGRSVPQLILFRKTAAGWQRQQLTGAQSVASARQFLAAASESMPVAAVEQRTR